MISHAVLMYGRKGPRWFSLARRVSFLQFPPFSCVGKLLLRSLFRYLLPQLFDAPLQRGALGPFALGIFLASPRGHTFFLLTDKASSWPAVQLPHSRRCRFDDPSIPECQGLFCSPQAKFSSVLLRGSFLHETPPSQSTIFFADSVALFWSLFEHRSLSRTLCAFFVPWACRAHPSGCSA